MRALERTDPQYWREKHGLTPSAPSQLVAVPSGPSGLSGSQKAEELARVLQALADWFRRFVYLPDQSGYDLLALWVAHTWAIERLGTTPRLLLDRVPARVWKDHTAKPPREALQVPPENWFGCKCSTPSALSGERP
jgi:hypothetical protein